MSRRSLYVRTRYQRCLRLRRVALCARILNHLCEQRLKEENLSLRDDIQVALRTVRFAAEGNPIPFVMASYETFGVHPDRVWGKIMAWRKANLKREYGQWYDESGNLRLQFLDIPDYDPMCGQSPSSINSEVPEEYPRIKWAKAPLRRVVRVDEVRGGSGAKYYMEELECGHFHTEFLGANPGNKRRRCHECSAAPKMMLPTEAKHANVVKATPLRRSKTRNGTLYEMPIPPRSTKQESLRILPAEAAG